MAGRPQIAFLAVISVTFFVCSGLVHAQALPIECSESEEIEWTTAVSDSTLTAGIVAIQKSRYQEADSLFQLATRVRATEAEAWYLLAKLNLDDHVDKPANASRFIKRALELEPDNIRFIVERLRQVNSGKSFFMGSDLDTPHWAGRILKVDSLEATAHATLGADFLGRYNHYLNVMSTNSNDVLAAMMDEALASAQEHLETALTIDPCRRDAYRSLIRLHLQTGAYDRAVSLGLMMQEYHPSEPEGSLYAGAAAYFSGRAEEASGLFEEAFALMEESESDSFRMPSYFLDDEQRLAAVQDHNFLRDFWESLRPRYLTDVNERVLAHYARLVYADTFFPYWRKYADDAWLITPGEVILRWGLPRGNFSNLDGADLLSRYLTLFFPNAGTVRFTDFTRNGENFVIDASMRPADDSPTAPGSDVMAARDQIHFTPQAYQHVGNARTVDIPYLVSTLKPLDGAATDKADVIISLGIPISPTDSNRTALGRPLDASNRAILNELFLTLGSFLIDESLEVAAQKRQTFYGLPENGLITTVGGTLWTTAHTHSVAAGSYRVSVEFETIAKDAIGATPATIQIPSFESDSLMLSDLVLAYSIDVASAPGSAPNHLYRNGLDISLAPWAVYAVTQPVYVYFEMYNLARDVQGLTEVEIEIALVPADQPGGITGFIDRLFGGEEEGVAVRSTYSGSSADDSQYVIVDASEQPPGEYRLVLRLRDLISDTVRQMERTVILEAIQ